MAYVPRLKSKYKEINKDVAKEKASHCEAFLMDQKLDRNR